MADFSALPSEASDAYGVDVSCAFVEHHVDDFSTTFTEDSPGTEVRCAFVEHHVDDFYTALAADGETKSTFGNSLDIGLDSYYTFNADIVTDDSGNGYNLLPDGVWGIPPVNVPGFMSNGCYFEDLYVRDYLQADAYLLRSTFLDSWTCACWFYKNTVDWNGQEFIANGAMDGPTLYLGTTDGEPQILDQVGTQELLYGSAISKGAWHHLVFSFDDTSKVAYIVVDGNWAGRAHVTFTSSIAFWPKYYGNGCYDAIIDELGLWNRSLTQEEVETLYNSGTGLVYLIGAAPVGIDVSCALVEHHVDDHPATFEES